MSLILKGADLRRSGVSDQSQDEKPREGSPGGGASGVREDELRLLSSTDELERVTLASAQGDLFGRAELTKANIVREVVLDDEARAEGDDLGELVLWKGVTLVGDMPKDEPKEAHVAQSLGDLDADVDLLIARS